MKRHRSMILAAVLGCLVGILISAAFAGIRGASAGAPGECLIGEEGVTNDMLTFLALRAAEYIKDSDYEALSKMVHPDFGLIFSPFATVNLSTNLSFSPRQVKDFADSREKLTWGVLPDSGKPITLTVGDYTKSYVFDRDYTAAPIIAVNYAVRVGNSRENVTDVFPGADFVDLCYPGTAEADYADWSILRLVFERCGDTLMLTAVIHSEATI